ncbi:hypothetical protein F2P81_008467 [Scophthalmus maximus]|uniref:Uncharacterized protein n=1 Tax=Scophthalmus maximus TaxID=52904 RepID=A0A6A4TDD4_SCOMX|nr:hypothetical protein F2P81_008467 [Scophthalmus maximus]
MLQQVRGALTSWLVFTSSPPPHVVDLLLPPRHKFSTPRLSKCTSDATLQATDRKESDQRGQRHKTLSCREPADEERGDGRVSVSMHQGQTHAAAYIGESDAVVSRRLQGPALKIGDGDSEFGLWKSIREQSEKR